MEMLLTVEQAAARLQLSPLTVQRQLKRGALRGVKKGHQWRVPESALLESANDKTPQAEPNPLARALAMVGARDAQAGASAKGQITPRVLGVNDAATELRAVREARTP